MKNASKAANKAVYIALGLLLIIVAVFALLNRGDAALKRALEENREFQIRIGGEAACTVGLQDLIDMQPQDFTATLATSITTPRETTLRGVELRLLLDALGIDTAEAEYFTVSGLDGYYSPLKRAEVYTEENVYICFSMDGEILKPQSEGGMGPFLMVIRGERFAQRWCKYVEAVDIEIKQ